MGARADIGAHLAVECEEILLDYVGQHPAQTRTAQAKATTYRLMSCIHASRVKSARSAWCVAGQYGGNRLRGKIVSYPVRIELPYFFKWLYAALHCMFLIVFIVLFSYYYFFKLLLSAMLQGLSSYMYLCLHTDVSLQWVSKCGTSGPNCTCKGNSNRYWQNILYRGYVFSCLSVIWVSISIHRDVIKLFGFCFCFVCQYGKVKKSKLLWVPFSSLPRCSSRMNPPSPCSHILWQAPVSQLSGLPREAQTPPGITPCSRGSILSVLSFHWQIIPLHFRKLWLM